MTGDWPASERETTAFPDGMTQALYNRIGVGYAAYRRPDARIAARIADALGSARTVVNVGAGAGSYEPADRTVAAVEPSAQMVRQRAPGAGPAVRATAERLPFRDASFDAALAVLTMHHWPDWGAGLGEMRRVARGPVVILTWDPDHPAFWLLQDYFPEILEIDRPLFPPFAQMERIIGPVQVRPVPVPADCTDGFLGAYWRRPEAYLDAGRRGAISTFTKLREVDAGLARLRADLGDGTWHRRHGHLLALPELDTGYRLLVA
jgi:SAM-dependent methyltransferase